ncbi:hypothetical protein FOMPIDRAFT_1016444 [Fomitopsis schrenkii]|uniref:Peptidase C14 caspase domain-containing protein n=1 Tax=Fomitopsis schrenkii TaxID=2126942 RepID=S8EBF0_FOMSC|nr:hypothetical protein FOMPIDRAFT_1016444 [Fomitopsis schrenkii]
MPGLTSTRANHRALSVAIEYTERGEAYVLRGAHRDPPLLKQILTEFMHYKEENITILMDDDSGKYVEPTYENILSEMRKLLKDARPDDHFVFHFSGHGSQLKNLDGTEVDGYDEELASDGSCETTGNYIMDDVIHAILVDHVPPGAHFIVGVNSTISYPGSTMVQLIFDCCHSGTAADLPNSTGQQPRSDTQLLSTSSRTYDGSPRPWYGHKLVPSETTLILAPITPERGKKLLKRKVADVTSWGACADDEITPGSQKGGVFLQRKIEKHNDLVARGRRSDDMYEPLEPRGLRKGSAFEVTHPEFGSNEGLSDALDETFVDDEESE